MIVFELLHPHMTHAHMGYIPGWLSWADERSAKEQIGANYIGGWFPYNGFQLDENNVLHDNLPTSKYESKDPPLYPLAQAHLRDELIVFYDHAWVAIIQPNRSYEVARID